MVGNFFHFLNSHHPTLLDGSRLHVLRPALQVLGTEPELWSTGIPLGAGWPPVLGALVG